MPNQLLPSPAPAVPAPSRNPAELGFPPLLPLELALRIAPVDQVCAEYGIGKQEFADLIDNPVFITAYQNAVDELRKDGMSFRLKAKVQAEQLLTTSWALIHHGDTPNSVKADLIKATVRWAGYEPKGEGVAGGLGAAFQININL